MHLILEKLCKAGIVVPIVQMRRLRLTGVNSFAKVIQGSGGRASLASSSSSSCLSFFQTPSQEWSYSST